MKKSLIIIMILGSSFANSQIIETSITAQDLPNLVPGYNQVSTINQQSLSFTYNLPPVPPTPVDGDTTTEGNGPLKYGVSIATNFLLANGNYTQTSAGIVWTLSIKVTGGAKSIGLTFDSLHLSPNAQLYLYNVSNTILLGPVKAQNLGQSTVLTAPALSKSHLQH